MKRKIAYILATSALIMGAFLVGKMQQNHYYATTAVVIEVSNNDLVTVEDSNGNVWQFTGEDWEFADVCSMLMDSKGTETIYDDEIVKVNHSSFNVF